MIKNFIKFILPKFIFNILKLYYLRISENYELKKFKELDSKKIFKKIYENKLWTPEEEKNNFKYYSGLGSHKDEYVKEYINKTKLFLDSLQNKPTVVELGCGDFEVSSNLINHTDNFLACDIYEDLINYNKKKYKDLKVDFQVLDMTKDELPVADICIVRCVLQHLSNDLISQFVNKIKNKFKYLLITEHYPSKKNFTPNIDIVTGPKIRLTKDSGVDLASNPFNLIFKNQVNICKIYSKLMSGYLNTQLYKL